MVRIRQRRRRMRDEPRYPQDRRAREPSAASTCSLGRGDAGTHAMASRSACNPGIADPLLEIGDERGRLRGMQLHQRRAHPGPTFVAAPMRDGLLQRRDHRIFLERATDRVQLRLQRVDVRRLPVRIQVMNGGRVHVGGRADAALAVAHVGEQERFAAGEQVEAVGCEPVQHRLRVVPVARRISTPATFAGYARRSARSGRD